MKRYESIALPAQNQPGHEYIALIALYDIINQITKEAEQLYIDRLTAQKPNRDNSR